MNFPLEMSTNMAWKNNQNLSKIGLLRIGLGASHLNNFQVILKGSSSDYKITVLCIRKNSLLELNQFPAYNIKQ